VLSRRLADRGLFPAIDVLRSVSRVANEITTKDHMQAAARARDLMATYGEAADLIQIGAYVAGSDPRVDAARAATPKLEALIRQGLEEGIPRAAALEALRAIVGKAP
jgi:flagellum-specific ATP synthase